MCRRLSLRFHYVVFWEAGRDIMSVLIKTDRMVFFRDSLEILSVCSFVFIRKREQHWPPPLFSSLNSPPFCFLSPLFLFLIDQSASYWQWQYNSLRELLSCLRVAISAPRTMPLEAGAPVSASLCWEKKCHIHAFLPKKTQSILYIVLHLSIYMI